jgi:hypothetical protein
MSSILGCLDGPIDQLYLVHTSIYQKHTKVSTVHTSTYQYMHVLEYLGSDEVQNHEGQRHCEHQHLHSITSHLGILLAINVKEVEVD